MQHVSALALFLLRRALRNRLVIGHPLFWLLQSEMHVPEISERYGLLLEAYLRGCGDNRNELIRQMEVVSCFGFLFYCKVLLRVCLCFFIVAPVIFQDGDECPCLRLCWTG